MDNDGSWAATRRPSRHQKDGDVWIAGSGLTYADLALFNIFYFIQHPDELAFKDMGNSAERANIFSKFPQLADLYKRVQEQKGMKEYLASRPAFMGV